MKTNEHWWTLWTYERSCSIIAFLRDLILNNHDRLYLDIYYAIFGLCLFCQYVQTETCTQCNILKFIFAYLNSNAIGRALLKLPYIMFSIGPSVVWQFKSRLLLNLCAAFLSFCSRIFSRNSSEKLKETTGSVVSRRK